MSAYYYDVLASLSLLSLLLLLTSPRSGSCQPSKCTPYNEPSPPLEKFVDSLPVLDNVINVSAGYPVTLGAYKIKQKVHRDLPETTLYAYGTSQATASCPGPRLEAIHGVESHVRWQNHITDKKHMLTMDPTLHWANPKNGGVPLVTHLHGGQVESTSDGHPDAWFTVSGETGKTFKTQNYTYPNTQDPAMLWYHDHTVGITRLNVYAGLVGLYFIRSADEENLNLPKGAYEVPLVLQDRQFYDNGTLQFSTGGDIPSIHPNWCPEFYGDVLLVNGMVWPYLNVEPRLYRFRIINAANSRFFTLFLSNSSIPFVEIGSDGGFLRKPMSLLPNVTIGPAERLDVLIDFSSLEPGTEVFLNNSASSPYPEGYAVFDNNNDTKVIMRFSVVAAAASTTSHANGNVMPSSLPGRRLRRINHKHALVRNLTLLQFNDNGGSTEKVLLSNLTWTDHVTETPKEGAVEVWRIINLNNRTHPIHVHLINFKVLDQQAFDGTRYNANNCSLDVPYRRPHHYKSTRSCYTEKRKKPDNSQLGWKDTVSAAPWVVTRLLMRFTTSEGKPFPFNATSEPGYLWHCHMVDHEDNDMMRPMKVQKA